MDHFFTIEDIKIISDIFGTEPEQFENNWMWRLGNKQSGQSLILSIYNEVLLDNRQKGCLLSVQTQYGCFELHDCSNFLVFEPDEIIFVSQSETHISSLIVGRQCSCSLYSNISREILKSDITMLDTPVLLAAMQLALTETIIS